MIAEHGATPSSLPELLETSDFVFVLATVTAESEHLLGAAELDRVRPGARLVLVSRAAVVDYDALLDRVADGRFLAGVDVWPTEPVPADHPARSLEGLVLSAHRAGGIPAAFRADRGHGPSTTWLRSPAACRRCGCRWPAASWSPATATARSPDCRALSLSMGDHCPSRGQGGWSRLSRSPSRRRSAPAAAAVAGESR